MVREVVGSMSDWSGVLKDLFRQFHDGSLTLEQATAFKEHRNPFEILLPVQGWQDFYRKHFGVDVDFSTITIPKHRPGFDRLIIVVQGLTLNQTYNVCVRQFPCWRYAEDLDKAISHNDRDAKNGGYAVWFRNRQEADEELKNISADQLAEQKIPGITLLERLLYELKYWNEAGEHLDISNWTFCTGSRNADGYVPRVNWSGGRLKVTWRYSYDYTGILRSRAAVP